MHINILKKKYIQHFQFLKNICILFLLEQYFLEIFNVIFFYEPIVKYNST